MSRKGRGEALVGKGVDKKTLNVIKSEGTFNMTVHKINKDAWKAFYASEEGKRRLRMMKELNSLKLLRYQTIVAGNGMGTTDKEIYETWRNAKFNPNGTLAA